MSKLTRDERDKLNRKRALNPTLSGAAAGASGAALATQLGGSALRNLGQKKTFDNKSGEYKWTNKNVSPRKIKASRFGSKVQAKAIPLTLAAGGLNAVAAANGIQMSHLWNKKDKVYDQVKKSALNTEESAFSKSRNDYRTLEEIDRRATRQRKKKRDSMAVSSLAAGTSVASLGSDNTYRQAKKFARDTKPLVTRMGPGAKDPWGKKIPISRQVRGLGQGINRNARLSPRGAAVAGGLALAGAAAGKAGYHKGRESGYQNTALSRRKNQRVVSKAYDPESKYRKGQRRRSDASVAVGGAGAASAGFLGSRAVRDFNLSRTHRASANSQFAESARLARNSTRGDIKYKTSDAWKNKSEKLGQRAKINQGASLRTLGSAKKFGAGAVGAATLGGLAFANAGRHRKNERDRRTYRRRQWTEPVGKSLFLADSLPNFAGTAVNTVMPSQFAVPMMVGQAIGQHVPPVLQQFVHSSPSGIGAKQYRSGMKKVLSPIVAGATGMVLAQPVSALFGRRTKPDEYRPGVKKSDVGWDYGTAFLGGVPGAAVRTNLRAKKGKRTKATAKVVGSSLGAQYLASRVNPGLGAVGNLAGTFGGVKWAGKDMMKDGHRRKIFSSGLKKPARYKGYDDVKKSAFNRD